MKKITVIEDNEAINKLFTTILLRNGYDVSSFRNGMSALEALPNIQPDLIIMDILLPDINGTELIHKVKELDKLQNVPIVAVTGFATGKDCKKMIELGFSNYISKPINTTLFVEEVKKMIE